MINLTILSVLLLIAILSVKDNDYPSFFSFMLGAISGGCLIVHLIAWSIVSIEFDAFKAKHDQLKSDLEISRSFTDSYERMSILQEISKHNQEIAANKKLNENWFMDQYIDDRIESLQTIK